MLTLALAALTATATAQDCDARALEKRLADASPAAVARAYTALAACDADKAKRAAPKHLVRMVADSDADEAAAAAIVAGAGDAVSTWLSEQLPDARTRTLASIGRACPEQPDAIGPWFVAAHADAPDTFWAERWYRGLAQCRTEGVQALLAEALTSPQVGRESRERSGFLGLLEIYAVNLGADAIPTLVSYLEDPKDDEEATLVVGVFGPAAGVGSREGTDAEAAKLATAELTRLAPTLPRRALDKARSTLVALGSPEAASQLAKHAWPDRFTDGVYTYGVALVEDISCKNDKQRAVLHVGALRETGDLWPDELATQLQDKLVGAWESGQADKCKGTATYTVEMTPAPLGGAATLEDWRATQRTAFVDAFGDAQKTWIEPHDAIAW